MSTNHANPLVPFSVAAMGIATFAGMDALMKSLGLAMGAYNAILWRTGVAVVIALVIFALRRPSWPGPAALRIHLLRGTITAVMAFLFFWGIIYVPLAEAIGLSFIAPLLALYLAAVLLGEKVGPQAIMASVIGLLGAAVIVVGKLSGDYGDKVGLGIAAILLSAVMYAYNLILQRRQALMAHPVEISLFQNSTVFALYLLLAPWFTQLPPVEQWPNLVGAACLAIMSVLCLSWAYARAEARILIPVEYTAFIWATILGWLMFNEAATLTTLAGTALIVAGCLIAARQHPDDVEHVETTAI